MTKHYGIKITLDDYFAPVTEDNTIGLFNVNATTASAIIDGGATATVELNDVGYIQVNSICRIQDGTDYIDCTITAIDAGTKIITLNKYDSDIMPLLGVGSTLTCNSSFFLAMDTSLNDTYSHWIDGILEDIGEVRRSLKKVKTGYIQNQDSLKITINNLAKFWDSIRALDVSNLYSISGAKVELWYFEIDQDNDITKEIVLWTGFCEQPDYDSLTYNITAKCFTGRDAVMTREEDGQTQSVSFGEGALLKMEPLSSDEDIDFYDISKLTSLTSFYDTEYGSTKNKIYALRNYLYDSVSDTTNLFIIVGSEGNFDASKYAADTTFLSDNFVLSRIVDGEIQESRRTLKTTYEIQFFEDTSDSYFSLLVLRVTIPGQFDDLVDISSTTDTPTYFAFSPNVVVQYNSLATIYSQEVTLDNGFKISPETFGRQIYADQYWAGYMFSYKTPTKANIATKSIFSINDILLVNLGSIGVNNCYLDIQSIARLLLTSYSVSASVLSNGSMIDKDKTTYKGASVLINSTDTGTKYIGLMYSLSSADLPGDRNICIGLRSRIKTSVSGNIKIKVAPVYYGSKKDYSADTPTYTKAINVGVSPDNIIDNISDRYFSGDSYGYTSLSRYFDTGISDSKTVERFDVFIGFEFTAGIASFEFCMYELCLLKEIEFDKSAPVYPRVYGRTFDTTSWSRAITSTNYIRSASDIIEHAFRFGNWRDVALNTTPGFTYAEYAKILNTGVGSFANAALVARGEYFPLAGNVTQEKTNIELIEDIVAEAGLVVYETKDGYAACRVNYSGDAVESNTTIADYIEVEELTIMEQDMSEIYCEPSVNYDYDPRTDKYMGSIAVTSTSKSTFATSYVTGDISDTDKEYLWTLCRRLYLQSRKVTTQPDELKNLQFANDPIYGKDVALQYLKTFVRSMFEKTVEFETATDLVQEWELGRIITVKAANQTNNNVITCMVTDASCEIVKDRVAKISAVLLDEIPEDTLYLDSYSSDNDFQDVYSGTQYNDI